MRFPASPSRGNFNPFASSSAPYAATASASSSSSVHHSSSTLSFHAATGAVSAVSDSPAKAAGKIPPPLQPSGHRSSRVGSSRVSSPVSKVPARPPATLSLPPSDVFFQSGFDRIP